MKKKYLVTGGSGFIGSSLVKALLKNNYIVKVLDNNSRGNMRRLEGFEDKIEFFEGDIRNKKVVQSATDDVDGVIHLAYINGTKNFYAKPDLVLDVALKGMLNIIEVCIEREIGDLIVASSSEVYQQPNIIPTPENVPLIIPDIHNPRYSYGGGKILCELMAVTYGKKYLDRVTIFRPHNVYGPDMGWEHVVPQFIIKAKNLSQSKVNNKIFEIKGNGEQTRAFIFIDDFTNGLLNVIEKGKHLEIYHIGKNEEVKIIELAKSISAYYSLDCEFHSSESFSGETIRRCPEISKLESLGFNPNIDLKTGLEKTINWYDKNLHLMVG